jgi:hypothetical protein
MAQVVKDQAVWDGPVHLLPSEPVHPYRAVLTAHYPVALVVDCPRPQVAAACACGVHPRYEPCPGCTTQHLDTPPTSCQ